jgi:hypothetical protein
MVQRCTNENWPQYKDWGGRGITIEDPRWLEFPNFLADMGERPPGLTLERKDNNGPYALWNCIWATPHEQHMNTRVFKLTPPVVARAKELRAAGATIQLIADTLDLSWNTASRALSGKTRQRGKRP